MNFTFCKNKDLAAAPWLGELLGVLSGGELWAVPHRVRARLAADGNVIFHAALYSLCGEPLMGWTERCGNEVL